MANGKFNKLKNRFNQEVLKNRFQRKLYSEKKNFIYIYKDGVNSLRVVSSNILPVGFVYGSWYIYGGLRGCMGKIKFVGRTNQKVNSAGMGLEINNFLPVMNMYYLQIKESKNYYDYKS